MALLQSNETISVTRSGKAVLASTNAPIYIKPPSPMNVDMAGVQVTTDLLADPSSSWQVNDIMHIQQADGRYQVTDYTVESAIPPRTGMLLPVWRIRIRGAIR